MSQATYKNTQLKNFGLKLKFFRIEKGFSQESLALLCGIDRSYLGAVERGEKNISLLNIYKLASALSVDIREFF